VDPLSDKICNFTLVFVSVLVHVCGVCVCIYIHIYVYVNRFGISYGLVFCFSYFSCHSSIAAFSFHFYGA